MQSELQFANRRAFPVHAEYGADHEWTSTGIGFEEYSRMQTSARVLAPGRQLETPSWAVNDRNCVNCSSRFWRNALSMGALASKPAR